MLLGAVPGQLCESRMVSLPKPNMVTPCNLVNVADLRPITMLSSGWRLWASAWTPGPLKSWMKQHVPNEFAVAHSIPTGEVVVDLLEDLFDKGYLMTLNFPKTIQEF